MACDVSPVAMFCDHEYLDKDCDQYYDFDGVFVNMMVEIDNDR